MPKEAIKVMSKTEVMPHFYRVSS